MFIEKCRYFLELAFCRNYWGWTHALGGALLANIGLAFHLRDIVILLIIFGLAILWEIIEWFLEGKKTIQIYGSFERFYYDCIGDILLATGFCALVIFRWS